MYRKRKNTRVLNREQHQVNSKANILDKLQIAEKQHKTQQAMDWCVSGPERKKTNNQDHYTQ